MPVPDPATGAVIPYAAISGLLAKMNRKLALLWLGQLLSGIGDRLHLVALMWIAVEAVGERAGFVAAAGPAAQLIFGLLGGVYADRWNKRISMISADLLRALAVASLAAVGALGEGGVSLWHLAGVGFALGVLDGLFQPALRSSLPLLAGSRDALQKANAWFEITQRLAAVLGPPLTGLLLARLSIEEFFAIDATTFCASALTVFALGRASTWKARGGSPVTARRTALAEIRTAVGLVAANRPVAWSMGVTAVWNIGSSCAMTVGLPLLARDVLDGGPALYGYLVGAYGVGNVASNTALILRPVRNQIAALFGGGAIWGVGFVLLAIAPTEPLALFACALAAIGGPITDVPRAFLMQTEFPPDQIGKVYSLRITVSKVSSGLGLLLAAPLFAFAGVRPAIAASAAIVALVSLYAMIHVTWSERARRVR